MAQTLDPKMMIPVFIVWIAIFIVVFLLFKKQKLTLKTGSIILVIAFIVGGVIFAAIPNPVMPIQQIFSSIKSAASPQTILPMILILVVFLVSVLILGRMLCGYACPLGAIQELLSKLYFKNSLKAQKKVKFTIKLPKTAARIIRLVFTGVFIVSAIVWGGAFVQKMNVFTGFHIFTRPEPVIAIIPLVFLVFILVASVFVYRPWCRLFCPFGALAGEVGNFSKMQIVRTDTCTNCGICEKICPTQVAGRDDKKGECYLCGRCIDSCPTHSLIYTKGELKGEPKGEKKVEESEN
jgi:polyferredoxin